jgi:hypothetical protein
MRPLKKLGLNLIIYGMMLACIAQCHCAITKIGWRKFTLS